jgi:single-strand selective monofunctional uracil DNA glycosylase
MATSAADRIIQHADRLTAALEKMHFSPPVAAVYNPLRYAREPFVEYHRRFAGERCRYLFLGMNPGPWGMAQTGVPFGEIEAVRSWMGIEQRVGHPETEHPKRPVLGFACEKSEVSGRRLWGLMRERFGTAEAFFAEHFVANYCPLVFMGETGRNITPDKLPADERAPLFDVCDEYLRTVVLALEPRCVVGVGKFAERRAETALASLKRVPQIVTVLHPSPASPAANRDWAGAATRTLIEHGIWKAQ